jgi:hypothetical protein
VAVDAAAASIIPLHAATKADVAVLCEQQSKLPIDLNKNHAAAVAAASADTLVRYFDATDFNSEQLLQLSQQQQQQQHEHQQLLQLSQQHHQHQQQQQLKPSPPFEQPTTMATESDWRWVIRSMSAEHNDCFYHLLAVLYGVTIEQLKLDLVSTMQLHYSTNPAVQEAIHHMLQQSAHFDPTRMDHASRSSDIAADFQAHVLSDIAYGGADEASILSLHPSYQHLQLHSINWKPQGGVVKLNHVPATTHRAIVAWVHTNHYALIWRCRSSSSASSSSSPSAQCWLPVAEAEVEQLMRQWTGRSDNRVKEGGEASDPIWINSA